MLAENETLFTVPCELVFNNHPRVRRTALVGPHHEGRIVPVLCVELLSKASRKERHGIRDELLALGTARTHTQSIRKVLFHPGFPVDIRHNAKINRPVLTRWAEGRA